MRKLWKFSFEFKTRVALEALLGALTMAELAVKHDVHPNMNVAWERPASVIRSSTFTHFQTLGRSNRLVEFCVVEYRGIYPLANLAIQVRGGHPRCPPGSHFPPSSTEEMTDSFGTNWLTQDWAGRVLHSCGWNQLQSWLQELNMWR